jgi:ureidoacrylate peracid hydrolase
VESTARDAFFGEFWPILVEDAMNHTGPDFCREATLWNFEHVFGWVTRTGSLIEIFDAAARRGAMEKAGQKG